MKEVTDYRHSKAYDEKEKAVLHYADLVTRGAAASSDAVFDGLGKYFSDDEIVELTLMICLANFNNRFTEALLVDPDVVVK